MHVMEVGRKLEITNVMGMTMAELRTVKQILSGFTYKEIAYAEGISVAAVSGRIRRAMKRNGFTNKTAFFIECEKIKR